MPRTFARTHMLVAVLAITVVGLAGCGGDEEAAPDDGPADEAGEEPADEADEDPEEEEEEAEDADDEAGEVGTSLYAESLHDLDDVDVPEPGTAQASLADGDVITFDIVDACEAVDEDERDAAALPDDHERPGEDDTFIARLEYEHGDGTTDRMEVFIQLEGDSEDVRRTESVQVRRDIDDETMSAGAGQLVWLSEAGQQAGEGESPGATRVNEDLEFTATGELVPNPGASEDLRGPFEIAGACE